MGIFTEVLQTVNCVAPFNAIEILMKSLFKVHKRTAVLIVPQACYSVKEIWFAEVKEKSLASAILRRRNRIKIILFSHNRIDLDR